MSPEISARMMTFSIFWIRYEIFMDMRQFFERYELLQSIGVDPDEEPWASCKFDGMVGPEQLRGYNQVLQ